MSGAPCSAPTSAPANVQLDALRYVVRMTVEQAAALRLIVEHQRADVQRHQRVFGDPNDPEARALRAQFLAQLDGLHALLDDVLGRSPGGSVRTPDASVQGAPPDPVPMLLFCPSCYLQHIDAPEPDNGWTNPPHKSHLCRGCKTVWRPADVPTTGVLALVTRGKADTWP